MDIPLDSSLIEDIGKPFEVPRVKRLTFVYSKRYNKSLICKQAGVELGQPQFDGEKDSPG